jgi:hypothetical protein
MRPLRPRHSIADILDPVMPEAGARSPHRPSSSFLPTQVPAPLLLTWLSLRAPLGPILVRYPVGSTSTRMDSVPHHPSTPHLRFLFIVALLHVVAYVITLPPFPSLCCPSNSVPPAALSLCIAVIRCLTLLLPHCVSVTLRCHRVRRLRAQLLLSGPHSSHPYQYRP